MGGEHSPLMLFQSILEVSRELRADDVLFVFVQKDIVPSLQACLLQSRLESSSVELFPVEEEVAMDEPPLQVVRRKKHSSMAIAIQQLQDSKIDALISLGNTGALVAYSSLSLSMLPLLEKPALLVEVPSMKGPVAVLDVGAQVDCKWEHLVQFARMGLAYQRVWNDVVFPKLGLLNIGTEESKGPEYVRRAFQEIRSLSQQDRFQFKGNIEGSQAFSGEVDVLVADGFSGNIFLKTAEGMASYISNLLSPSFCSDIEKEEPVAKLLVRKTGLMKNSQAVLCGLDRLVVKCHGSSSPQVLAQVILNVRQMLQNKFQEKMQGALS